MPEIKHVFSQGKMNKDLDERLVPNGQYRDAMNIQISTSEGSDVGAVKNILGNSLIAGQDFISNNSVCVGSVADEKNNKLYYFITDNEELLTNPGFDGDSSGWSLGTGWMYNDGKIEGVDVANNIKINQTLPVNTFIASEEYEVSFTVSNYVQGEFELRMRNENGQGFNVTNIVLENKTYTFRRVVGTSVLTTDPNFQNRIFIQGDTSNTTSLFTGDIDNVSIKKTNSAAIIEYDHRTNSLKPVLVDTIGNVLNFKDNNIITGINIIDNLLLWTDNVNEPKKINIDLCKRGTVGYSHTKLIVDEREIDLASGVDIREEHITVIKKAPKEQLSLTMQSGSDILLANYTGSFQDNFGTFQYYLDALSGNNVSVGDLFIMEGVTISSGSGVFLPGDVLSLKEPSTLGSLPFVFDMKVKIINDLSNQTILNPFYGQQGFSNVNQYIFRPANSFEVEIIIANGQDFELNYEVFKETNDDDVIFDKRLVRFSCRYRYQDGEYSTFSPFSELAFLPSIFNYETKRAYNTGMQNYLKSLELNNFIQTDILEDVVQIDILYKESNSTNVYIVDKLKFKDTKDISLANGAVTNSWISDSYSVDSDTIYALLPSNQLLRPYDNVPRKALAQEMTGNRVVYGNYVQNYNINKKPMIQAGYGSRSGVTLVNLFPNKSLKSRRNYQLGVTYLDKFGRETPVFSSSRSTFKIPKAEAANKNAINFSITTSAPEWADCYKMFVKETSNEYYNLAMDRVYKAKDGNIWMSFPSSDRNKVDEETFLILKKQLDASVQVVEDLKYKIIAIESEAPEFIKTKITLLSSSDGNGDITSLFTGDIPTVNSRSFEINEQVFKVDGGGSIDNVEEPLSLVFKDSVNNVSSEFYNIVSVQFEGGHFQIKLDRGVSLNDTWIYENYAQITSFSSSNLNTNLEIKIYKNIIKNKPEFDGRFFVKIENNSVTEQYVLQGANVDVNYNSIAVVNPYYIADNYAFSSGTFLGTTGNSGSNQSSTKGKWQENFEFDLDNVLSSSDSSDWFIDQAYYAGTQPLDGILDGDPTTGSNDDGYGKGIYKENGIWYMEISFGQIEPDAAAVTDLTGTIAGLIGNAIINTISGSNNYYAGDLNTAPLELLSLFSVGSSSNTNHVDQADVVSNIQENQLFKFLGDQDNVIYKISAPVERVKRYNYTNWQYVFDYFTNTFASGAWTNTQPYNNTHGVEMETRWSDFSRSLNRRITYRFAFEMQNGDEADIANNSSFLSGSNTYTSPLDDTYGADASSTVSIQFLSNGEGDEDQVVGPNPAIWETEPKENIELNIFNEASECFDMSLHGTSQELDWFNCYSFGNGVESNRLRDDFNQIIIDKGAVVSSTTDSIYKEERRKSGLIYSGLYNSINGVNNLNQFIAAEKITKDLNPTYGSIQKLFSRNTDLVSFCEDRIIRILANKDAVFNADGNPNLVATTNVLGQTMPFSGDYGISQNPESFASESYRAYFTDKQKGVVLRLSMDGLTPISQYGMSDYFKDNLKNTTNIIGTYDTNKDEYNISLIKTESSTVSFSENVKGWSSFKSFVPEQGLSMANDYYTFKNGFAYKHHDENEDRNTFYTNFTPSHVTVLLNDEPSIIKSYKTLNYTGSADWYAEYIESEKQKGSVNEFVKKEGKWFNFIKGNEIVDVLDIKTEEFSFQGIGIINN